MASSKAVKNKEPEMSDLNKNAAETANIFAGTAFAVSQDKEPEAVARVGRASVGEDAVYQTMTIVAKAPEPTGKPYRFFVPADEAPASITDASERDKAAKENQRRLNNRIGGYVRKLTKGTDAREADGDKKARAAKTAEFPNVAFELRRETENGKLGISVYRVKAGTASA